MPVSEDLLPKAYPRARRIGEQIQRELPALIRMKVKDPGVSAIVTVTGVEVTADYAHAKIFFTCLGDEQVVERTSLGLSRAAGYLRVELGPLLRLRSVPQLHFAYDRSVEEGMRLSRLIDIANTPGPTDRK